MSNYSEKIVNKHKIYIKETIKINLINLKN